VCVCVWRNSGRGVAEDSGPAGWPVGGGEDETTLPPL